MPPKNGTADDDSESGEDDFIKGVPDEDEDDEFENRENGENGQFAGNFAAQGGAQNWGERGGEGEGDAEDYPQEGFDESAEYSEEGIDPYAGTPEEDVDVDGAAEEREEEAREEEEEREEDEEDEEENEDEEDVDVDGDTGSKPGNGGPDDELSNDAPEPMDEDKAKPSPAAATPVVVFEPEYEPLDFERGNALHREAFYSEWEKVVTEQDDSEEVLVPIRLDLVIENARVQDTFVWNLKEKSITPDQYAEMMCVDLDLPQRAERIIADAIRQQLGEHRDLVPPVPAATSRPAPPGTLIGALPECLVTIKVDLTVNQILLHDQFEWDVNNPSNSPEPFARSLCQDLGLSREFEACIAHSIREQLAYHAQFTVPFLQHMHARTHEIVTAERCVREDADLPLWTPVVSAVTPAQRPAPGAYAYGTPQGPVRHSSRLREAASSQAAPYSLRAGSTPNR